LFYFTELESALDYQLQDSSFELVAKLKAHIGYWKSSDVAMFIIQQLCTNDLDLNLKTSSDISNIPSASKLV
jgi:hypothetical protein